MQLATFGTDVPYWDQWDGEIAALYKPFMDGTLSLSQFVAPHNEHRILFSRVFNLILFATNEAQFDNLVETYANSILYAIALAVFAWPVLRRMHGAELLLGWLAVVIAGIVPFAYDNLLFGFQNAFYFMNAFAVGSVALVTLGNGRSSLVAALTLAFLSLFTLASGLLLAPTIAFVALLRWRRAQLSRAAAFAVTAAASVIAICGCLLLPHVAPHDALRAQDWRDFIQATINIASWPLPGGLANLLLLWWPSAVVLWRIAIRRDMRHGAIDLYLLGISAWAFLQVLAIAHSRGHEMLIIASRYLDTIMLAPLANIALAVRLLGIARKDAPARGMTAAVSFYALACVCGFAAMSVRAMPQLFYFANSFEKNRAHLRAYLSGEGMKAIEGKPGAEISYPHASRLSALLEDATIRAMLPSSIREPVSAPAGNCSAFEPFGAYPTTPAMPKALGSYITSLGNPSMGSCSSAPFGSRRSYLQFRIAGYPRQSGMSLMLNRTNGTAIPIVPSFDPRESWLPVTIANPEGPVSWTATDLNPQFWFSLTLPVEVGRLSALRQKLDIYLDVASPWTWQ
ncbi:MAG TPA: hypothetical protein VM555_06550 [Tahibacter sp.]|nr:hypothetical protein [Tahibacter sp.]